MHARDIICEIITLINISIISYCIPAPTLMGIWYENWWLLWPQPRRTVSPSLLAPPMLSSFNWLLIGANGNPSGLFIWSWFIGGDSEEWVCRFHFWHGLTRGSWFQIRAHAPNWKLGYATEMPEKSLILGKLSSCIYYLHCFQSN